jgi:stage V sporulation protein G
MVRAYVDITLDNCFVVRDLRIIHSSRGYLVAMPSRERRGKRVDIAHPITAEARRMIEEAVMAEYWKLIAEAAGQTRNNT